MIAASGSGVSGIAPLETWPGAGAQDPKRLGKNTLTAIRLRAVPGSVSLPSIQVGSGVALMAMAVFFLERKQFWALAPLVIGFVLFFLGVQQLKGRDRRIRRIQPRQQGFDLQVGEQRLPIPYAAIADASLETERLVLRQVPMGDLHELSLSLEGGRYRVSSFEAAGMEVREADPFALWAKGVVALVEKRKGKAAG